MVDSDRQHEFKLETVVQNLQNLSPHLSFCSVAFYGKFEKAKQKERVRSRFILVTSAFPHLLRAATRKSCQLYK
jgi:hypothetical protein